MKVSLVERSPVLRTGSHLKIMAFTLVKPFQLVYPLVNVYGKLWNITIFKNGKPTITKCASYSIAIFYSHYSYQRVRYFTFNSVTFLVDPNPSNSNPQFLWHRNPAVARRLDRSVQIHLQVPWPKSWRRTRSILQGLHFFKLGKMGRSSPGFFYSNWHWRVLRWLNAICMRWFEPYGLGHGLLFPTFC